jgi:peptidoglycan/xylan/chitin deacetylase (PgdA/CDA1 family)
LIKRAMLNLIRASGAFDLLRAAHRRQGLILTYHRFSEGEENDKTSARVFAEQLDYLSAHYRVAPLSQLVDELSSTTPEALHSNGRKGLAAITIDDGYRDAFEIAYPLLRRRGLPATLYVVSEFLNHRIWIWTDKARYLCAQAQRQRTAVQIDGRQLQIEIDDQASRRRAALLLNDRLKTLADGEKEEALRVLAKTLGVETPALPPDAYRSVTWEQTKELDRNNIEIGSHTRTHPILTNITEHQLRNELLGSRLELEEALNRPVEQFCYPNGDQNERVHTEVARAGYRVAVTTVSGLTRKGDDPLRLNRIHTERDLTHFIQSTSGFEQTKNRLRSWNGNRRLSAGMN